MEGRIQGERYQMSKGTERVSMEYAMVHKAWGSERAWLERPRHLRLSEAKFRSPFSPVGSRITKQVSLIKRGIWTD